MLQAKMKTSEQKARVLVVDDEKAICTSLANVLIDENFETRIANDGPDALKQLAEFDPDLVFLDIWMSGWDGIETLEKIKEVSPLTEVVMISGHATINNALDAMRRGAFDLIEKPFAIESVISTAMRALQRRRERQPNETGVGLTEYALKRREQQGLIPHPGLVSQGCRGRNLGQRTLRESVVLYGQGLHSGMKSGLILEPMPANSGIYFSQMGSSDTVPVFIDYVESTDFATTIRFGASAAATIEHLMAVLHAYGISNLLIKSNGEVPILDGSALQFCSAIDSVGIEEQGGEWYEVAVDRKITIDSKGPGRPESLSIEPADSFSVTYELDYPAPVGKQTYTFVMSDPESFKAEIAAARTFGFMKDIEKLQRVGLAAGGRLNNFILIGPDGIVNTELRYENELCRHKILDAVGDLFLIGRPIRAAVKAHMTGHSDNVALMRRVREVIFG